MPQKVKNSILLACLLLLLTVFGYYWLFMILGKEKQALVLLREDKQSEYTMLKELADRYQVYVDSLQVMQKRFLEYRKILPSREDSKVTYAYFNNLASQPDSYVHVMFQAGNTNIFDDYVTAEYTIEGTATFYALYNFLWKLEQYKRFYTIESFDLQEIKKTENPNDIPKSYIKFHLNITGYSSTKDLPFEEDLIDTLRAKPVAYNPFLPLVQEYIPPNTENLLNVSEAVLQGLTDDKAFIADSKGKLRVMQTGDRVYLGYLTEINKTAGWAAFTLNKGGFIDKRILRLKKS